MPTPTPTPPGGPYALADAFAAIDNGVSIFDIHAGDRCVTPEEFARVDAEAEALENVKTLITHLADLLDGVLADDPQAIRDAAAWLAANRPEPNPQ